MKQLFKICLLSIAAVLLLFMVACGGPTTEPDSSSVKMEPTSAQSENTEPVTVSSSSESKPQKETLTFYYADEQLFEILKVEREINFETEQDKWGAIWDVLQNPTNEIMTALWENVELENINRQDDTLTISISKPTDMVQFGSTAEGLALQTLIQTFGQIEGVESIQLLVNGKVQETLSGHVNIASPFDKDAKVYNAKKSK